MSDQQRDRYDISRLVILTQMLQVSGEWERQMSLVIKPKPKWMPRRLHYWLIKTFLVQKARLG